MLGGSCQPNERRDRRIHWSLQPGQDRTDTWAAAYRSQRFLGPARRALQRIVPAGSSDHRSNGHKLIHHRCDLWKDFADLYTRYSGGNRGELATNFRGSIGFEVPHVLVRWATRQEDIDDGFVSRGTPRARLDPVEVRQQESAGSDSQRTDLEKASPGYAVTIPALLAENR